MKKYLLVLFLLISGWASAQIIPINAYGYKWKRGLFDSAFGVPYSEVPTLKLSDSSRPGLIYFATLDSTWYGFTGYQWKPIGLTASTSQVLYSMELSEDSLWYVLLGDDVRFDSVPVIHSNLFGKSPILITDTLPGTNSFLISIDESLVGGSFQQSLDRGNTTNKDDTISTQGFNFNFINTSNGFQSFRIKEYWENSILTVQDSAYGFRDRGLFSTSPTTIQFYSSGDSSVTNFTLTTDVDGSIGEGIEGYKVMQFTNFGMRIGTRGTSLTQTHDKFDFAAFVKTGELTRDLAPLKVLFRQLPSASSPTDVYVENPIDGTMAKYPISSLVPEAPDPIGSLQEVFDLEGARAEMNKADTILLNGNEFRIADFFGGTGTMNGLGISTGTVEIRKSDLVGGQYWAQTTLNADDESSSAIFGATAPGHAPAISAFANLTEDAIWYQSTLHQFFGNVDVNGAIVGDNLIYTEIPAATGTSVGAISAGGAAIILNIGVDDVPYIALEKTSGSGNIRIDNLTGNRDWQMPDADGTIALTSDIPGALGDAAADGVTKGQATFSASDFNSSAGLISLDYPNMQTAASGVKGLLTGADWDLFNGKAGLVSPSFTTPSLGVATATSINKVTITEPATSATLTIANNKTLTVNNSITFAGTDGTTMTFPTTTASIARTDAAQSFTGLQSIASGVQFSPGGSTGLLYGGAAGTTIDFTFMTNASNTLSSGTATRLNVTHNLNQTGTAGSITLLMNRTHTAIGSGTHKFISGQISSVEQFSISSTGIGAFSGLTSTLTTEQLRLSYDGSNYVAFTVASTGFLTIQPTGSATHTAIPSGITVGGTGSNLYIGSNTGTVTTTASQYLFAGASTINMRAGVRGSSNATPGAGNSYASLVVGENASTIASSGTHALFANLLVKPLAITGGSGTLTNSSSLYIENGTTGATNNYAVWSDAGVNRFDGAMEYGYASTATSITLDATHHTLKVTATGQTETLPTAVGIQGRVYTIKLTASGSCTVATTSSQTIDGSTTYSLSAQYKYVSVQSDNANWIIIANN